MKLNAARLRRLIPAAALAFASLLPGAPWARADADAVRDWIAAHAIPLATPEAERGLADLQPLRQVIGDARIVALGEATHGTREFFQLKHRMLEFLATELGFTIFSIEANLPESYRVNDFVLTGRGDPARLLKGMYFWTWNTEEVLGMIRWMREFNRAGRGPVEFTGFDMQTPTVAGEIVRQFVARHDAAYGPEVTRALGMVGATQPAAADFGSATGTFPVAAAVGKRVRFSGYIKTDGVSGYAGLWWRVDGPDGAKQLTNLQERAPKGTTPWRRYELEVSVSPGATNINFGVLLAGAGAAWFDGLAVELDGHPFADPARFDFDFESAELLGLRFGSPSYSARLDPTIFHTGKQSLAIRRTTPAPTAARPDPKSAVAQWKKVIAHLEGSRAAYQQQGADERAVAWALQNATVVLQSQQMRTAEVPRDRSMAENVRWILNRNPGAKIVLWAHNGHVATGGGRRYEPMGATLRQWYGEQMVVVGFAFNRGSFQAIEQGKGLRDFTVPPAPAGSLDAMFASTGLPLFALDLRRKPASGPVANWFNQPHRSRSIGAVYAEDRAEAYWSELNAPENFDVMLFVENTTAARKNPPLPP